MFTDRRSFAMTEAGNDQRTPIPAVGSLRIDPERLAQLWRMTPQERLAMAQQGRLTLGEMLRWAACAPEEVPIVDGEFFFITALLDDTDDDDPDPRAAARHRRAQTPSRRNR
jgi:hypothetical protein